MRHVECGAFDGARPRGRRIADHWIATSTSIGMGKPGFEPRGSDGRPSVIELVERREHGSGEFGALSSEAGEEDDGLFAERLAELHAEFTTLSDEAEALRRRVDAAVRGILGA